jgi:zinc D-Ala-D-Ala carboxypeptidase
MTVSSGYRSAELCERIGSSSKSQHTRGEAADFEVFGLSNKDVSDWIVKNLDYDQCILEFWTPDEPNSGWIHCSYSAAKNRRQYLKASRQDGKIIYSPLI